MKLEYKGYVGTFDYHEGDEAFHGHVIGIRDMIHFQGISIPELRASFQEAVDDYLDFCVQLGREPQKPFTGKFVVRIESELHRQVSAKAKVAGVSLNQFVATALKHSLEVEA